MSEIRLVEPVVRICAVIAGRAEWSDAGIGLLTRHWGQIVRRSPPVPFEAGGFYTPTMGPNLTKTLVAFETYDDPAGLANWKTQTNIWEADLAFELDADVDRPVNLDVGYLTQAKLVLATIKDRDHRLYLRDGIFAEVTLNYVAGKWVHHRWTYPSYRTEPVAEFAMGCRDRLREHLLTTGQIRSAAGPSNSQPTDEIERP